MNHRHKKGDACSVKGKPELFAAQMTAVAQQQLRAATSRFIRNSKSTIWHYRSACPEDSQESATRRRYFATTMAFDTRSRLQSIQPTDCYPFEIDVGDNATVNHTTLKLVLSHVNIGFTHPKSKYYRYAF